LGLFLVLTQTLKPKLFCDVDGGLGPPSYPAAKAAPLAKNLTLGGRRNRPGAGRRGHAFLRKNRFK
jgi:hypothetical protein